MLAQRRDNFRMIRKVIFLFLILSSNVIFSADTVRVRTDVDFVVTASVGSNSFNINSDKPSGDGTSEAAPAKVYFPIDNSNTGAYDYYLTTTTELFDVSVASHVANIPVRVETSADGVQRYLHAAVKDTNDGNKYKYIQTASPTLSQGSQSDVIFNFSPSKICSVLVSLCQNLLLTSTSETEQKFTVYFFTSNQATYGASQEITPASQAGGIYFTMLMSNRTYMSTEMIISINKVRVGDNRLVLEYTSNATLNPEYAKSVRVFKHTTNTPFYTNSAIGLYGILGGSLTTTEYPFAQNGEVIVSGLENNIESTLSVAFVDKFNFVTNLSVHKSSTPLDIEELLKKQGCFLLTAGFGEEHYVINYFRHFRDATLSHYKLGRMFIQFYYENAPKYALQIYQSSAQRFVIRMLAYGAYYLFNFIWVIMGLFIFAYFGKKVFKNSQKIKSI